MLLHNNKSWYNAFIFYFLFGEKKIIEQCILYTMVYNSGHPTLDLNS